MDATQVKGQTVKAILTVVAVAALVLSVASARAQNWILVIRDNALNTPSNQVNGITGGTAELFATIFNTTGTPVSDDGTGSPAPSTLLDFAGFGFTLNPGQTDLESLFTPDPRIPFWPQVEGSADGSTPGSSGYVVLGTFDLTGLSPGTYEEDFTAGAFPDDFNSTVPFDDIRGTLVLNVSAPASVPEPGAPAILGAGLVAGMWWYRRGRR
jgi:hypothetical protein